jgi:hypothetical protein
MPVKITRILPMTGQCARASGPRLLQKLEPDPVPDGPFEPFARPASCFRVVLWVLRSGYGSGSCLPRHSVSLSDCSRATTRG